MCGSSDTSLAWYLGDPKPGLKARQTVQKHCIQRAVECRNGDTKTLVAKGFATVRGKELLPNRERLPHEWVDSECVAVRSSRYGRKAEADVLQLRKASTGSGDACRGLLWRLEDLEKVLSS